MKKTYKVAVTEILRRILIVEAADENEAHQRATDAWHNNEIVLVTEDFDGVEFHVIGEGGSDDSEKRLERIDGKND